MGDSAGKTFKNRGSISPSKTLDAHSRRSGNDERTGAAFARVATMSRSFTPIGIEPSASDGVQRLIM
eukprot:SAG31_NODE_29266_length_398_cov_0.695652_2_plen_66_part_01